MRVLMIGVRKMGVLVLQADVSMPVRMRRVSLVGFSVRVPMVFVMHMRMRVLHRVVDVVVLVAFGEV